MNVLYPICCGADVHKKFVTATILITKTDGTFSDETRTFSTMTNDLLLLKEWLLSKDCRHIAMESTGKYWIPVYNVLEDYMRITLANPRFVKNLPGKKTDPNDSRWIAKLHRHGLVPSSFVPPKDIRELRELTRYRTKLVNVRSAEKNRVQNTLTVCNIMLSNVATDIFGKSGTAIINSLLSGEDLTPDKISELTYGKLRSKIPQLIESLNGKLSEHHISKLRVNLDHHIYINEKLTEVEALITEKVSSYKNILDLLITVPGVKLTAAQAILAEIGPDMSVFNSALHFCSWAGVSPGSNQSGGKKKAVGTNDGNIYLKSILSQCAHAAVKEKNTCFSARYSTIKSRRGPQKAIIATCRVMLVAIYHMLTKKQPFHEVGSDSYLAKISDQRKKKMIRQLEALGYKVEKVTD